MDQRHRSLAGAALLVSATLMLAGCPAPEIRPAPPATTPQGGQMQGAPPSLPTPPPAQPPPHPPAPQRENRLSPATQSLVTQAKTLLSHGDIDGAASTLDRALRIEPNNPLLWIEVGRVRLVDSEARQAEGCARKALALATGDRAAQNQAGHLLIDALRAQGRNQDAQDVASRPYMH